MKTIGPTFLLLAAIATAQAQTGQEQETCQYMAEHMIEIARQSLQEPSSRPERVEQRRQLVEEWTKRLEDGEDPCAVFADIQQASTTF